jgi:HSP20 family protein
MEIMPWRSRQTTLSPSPISTLQSEMNRMLEDFFTQPLGFSPYPAVPLLRTNGPGAVIVPALDVKENNETITVTAELPGIERDNVEINIDGDMLELRGQKSEEAKQDTDNFHVLERSYGSFARRIRLPCEVDSDKAKASMDNGVLRLELPKCAPKAAKKKISIN